MDSKEMFNIKKGHILRKLPLRLIHILHRQSLPLLILIRSHNGSSVSILYQLLLVLQVHNMRHEVPHDIGTTRRPPIGYRGMPAFHRGNAALGAERRFLNGFIFWPNEVSEEALR